jgi:hypothetical protein
LRPMPRIEANKPLVTACPCVALLCPVCECSLTIALTGRIRAIAGVVAAAEACSKCGVARDARVRRRHEEDALVGSEARVELLTVDPLRPEEGALGGVCENAIRASASWTRWAGQGAASNLGCTQ